MSLPFKPDPTNFDLYTAIGRMDQKLDTALQCITKHEGDITELKVSNARGQKITTIFASVVGAAAGVLVGVFK